MKEIAYARDKAIITTNDIVNRKSDILMVIHDDEGDWQFLSYDDIDESDAIVISLNQIIEIDSSIEKILNIPFDTMAIRSSKNDVWITKKI